MRVIITVTRHPSLRNVYQISTSESRISGARKDVSDAGAAAALAMQRALSFGAQGYQIFAPAEVMDQIPADMRGRG